MNLKLGLITTLENVDTKVIGVREREGKDQPFHALWLGDSYIAFTKAMKEQLSKLYIKDIAPVLVNVEDIKTSGEDVTFKAIDDLSVKLKANASGFPLIDIVTDTDVEQPGSIVAIGIILKENQRVEKVFIEDFVKLRYYRVNDAEQNKLMLFLEHNETVDENLCTIVISTDGECTDTIIVSEKTFSVTEGSSFRPRKEGSNIRLRVDYLIPKEKHVPSPVITDETVAMEDRIVDTSRLVKVFSHKKTKDVRPSKDVSKFNKSHVSKNGGKSRNYAASNKSKSM